MTDQWDCWRDGICNVSGRPTCQRIPCLSQTREMPRYRVVALTDRRVLELLERKWSGNLNPEMVWAMRAAATLLRYR